MLEYPHELVTFANENSVSLPSITSMRGQALAFLALPENLGKANIGRKEAEQFFADNKMETQDAIQQFNKATGIKRISKRGFYGLVYPYEIDRVDIDKRKGVNISGDKDTWINAIKLWWQENLINVPNEQWQMGHLDPTIGDGSESNLSWQPPIQGKYRNRFKWDKVFHRMWPTGQELIRKWDKYYTEEEQKALYESLKTKYLVYERDEVGNSSSI